MSITADFEKKYLQISEQVLQTLTKLKMRKNVELLEKPFDIQS